MKTQEISLKVRVRVAVQDHTGEIEAERFAHELVRSGLARIVNHAREDAGITGVTYVGPVIGGGR